MKDLLNVKNLCYAYIKKPLCLKDVNFSVANNEKILILALDGQGKTTLINALSGFDTKYFGQVLYQGKDLKKISDEEKNFSIIYDNPVFINGSIDKNLNFLYKTLRIEAPNDDQKQKILKLFNLNYVLKDNVKKLSYFDKIKLCLVRIYIKNSNVVFIDNILNKNLTCTQVEELKQLMDKAFNKKTIILCADNNSFIKFKKFYYDFGFNKIFYLNNAAITVFSDLDSFQNNLFDLAACEFVEEINKFEGFCVYQDGNYFLKIEDKFVLKIDNNFEDKFAKLMLSDGENEDVILVTKNDVTVDFSKNNEFNDLLKNKRICIFSKLTGIRVL